MTSSPQDPEARPEAGPQQTRTSEEARRRRSNTVVGVAVGAAVVATVVAATVLAPGEPGAGVAPEAADGPVEGVQEFPDQSQGHVETAVDYPQTLPVGGDHLPVWQSCGFYPTPVQEGAGVHSLEHGAVWLGYDPALPEDDLAILQQLAAENPYLLVSPVDGLGSPVVASAWGVQLETEGVGDERLETFLVTYLQGEQTPEPGAPCTGGLDA